MMCCLSIGPFRMRGLTLALAMLLPGTGAMAQAGAGAPDPEVAVARPVELGCAPRAAWAEPIDPIRLIGSQEGQAKRMYGPGDSIIVSAGLDHGLAVGQEFYVRRQHRPGIETVVEYGLMPAVLHTAGWLRLVAVERTMSVAVVSHACDGFLQGDYLEPFMLPDVPPATPVAEADYESPASILFGEAGSFAAATLGFMVIDRGRDHGIQPGQRFTVYRDTIDLGGPVTNLGVAFAVLVDAAHRDGSAL